MVVTLLALPGAARAVTVTKTADSDDGVCNSDCSLREAINYSPAGSVIDLPAGTYELTIPNPGEATDPQGGDLNLLRDITINGAGMGQAVIDAGANPDSYPSGVDRVFEIGSENNVHGTQPTVAIKDLTITGGIDGSQGYHGSAIYRYEGSGSLELRRVAVRGNVSPSGDTIRVGDTFTICYPGCATDGTVNLIDVVVADNYGVGIHVTGATVNADGLEVSGNTNTGVWVQQGSVNLANTTIANNHGAGIRNESGTLWLNNDTVAGNGESSSYPYELDNTMSGFPPEGSPAMAVRNTIIGPGGCFAFSNFKITSQGHNIAQGYCDPYWIADPSDQVGADPQLRGLDDNGGPTETMALAHASPAIDQGGGIGGCASNDQRGVTRPSGACDIGAFEVIPGEPEASTEAATQVTSTEATLHATVNPHGHATTYAFAYGKNHHQYVDWHSYDVATDSASAGSDSAAHSVSVHLTGLVPGARYHFHVVTENSAGKAGGGDQAFVTEAADTDPPQTTITKGPKPATTKRDATFRFTSDEPMGASFACSIDARRFKACESPATYRKLALGRHTLKVAATDAASNTDPTPAAWSWKVKRER